MTSVSRRRSTIEIGALHRGWNERLINRGVPLVLVDVVDDEVAVELPVRPRPAALLRRAGDGGRVLHAILLRRFVIGAELAQKDRPVVFLRPRLRDTEILLDLLE